MSCPALPACVRSCRSRWCSLFSAAALAAPLLTSSFCFRLRARTPSPPFFCCCCDWVCFPAFPPPLLSFSAGAALPALDVVVGRLAHGSGLPLPRLVTAVLSFLTSAWPAADAASASASAGLPDPDAVAEALLRVVERTPYGAKPRGASAATDTARAALWRWDVVPSRADAVLPGEVAAGDTADRRLLRVVGEQVKARAALVALLTPPTAAGGKGSKGGPKDHLGDARDLEKEEAKARWLPVLLCCAAVVTAAGWWGVLARRVSSVGGRICGARPCARGDPTIPMRART